MPQIQFNDPSTRTRVQISYDFNPSTDYWKQIEGQCPAWVPPPLADSNSSSRRSSGRAVTWSDEDAKTRSMYITVPGRGSVEWVMPFQEYVPAIDPAGNICPLTIRTCRLPEDDGTGFDDKIRAAKKRAGWFIATRDSEFQGLMDQEYAAFLCALIVQRKAEHAEKERLYAQQQMSGAEKAVREQAAQLSQAVQDGAAANREVMMDVAKAVGLEVAKAMGRGKGQKEATE